MACVACRDLPPPSAEEPTLATSGPRTRAVPATPSRRQRTSTRRIRSAAASVTHPATPAPTPASAPATANVPAVSRITYRAGTVSIH